MNDPKIVKPGDVNFEDSSLNPDILGPNADVKDQQLIKPNGNYITTNMILLADKIVQHNVLGEVGNGYFQDISNEYVLSVQESVPLEIFKGILAHSVTLEAVPNTPLVRIAINQVNTQQIKDILEARFGTSISQAGFYNVLGLDEEQINLQDSAKVAELKKYFSRELGLLLNLNGKYGFLTINPYMTVMAMPSEFRPFFTGATALAEENKRFIVSNVNKVDAFPKPLQLEDILAYTNVIGELLKTKQYYDFYCSL